MLYYIYKYNSEVGGMPSLFIGGKKYEADSNGQLALVIIGDPKHLDSIRKDAESAQYEESLNFMKSYEEYKKTYEEYKKTYEEYNAFKNLNEKDEKKENVFLRKLVILEKRMVKISKIIYENYVPENSKYAININNQERNNCKAITSGRAQVTSIKDVEKDSVTLMVDEKTIDSYFQGISIASEKIGQMLIENNGPLFNFAKAYKEPEQSKQTQAVVEEKKAESNLSLVIPDAMRTQLAMDLDEYIKQQPVGSDQFYLESFRRMVGGNRLVRPFDKTDSDALILNEKFQDGNKTTSLAERYPGRTMRDIEKMQLTNASEKKALENASVLREKIHTTYDELAKKWQNETGITSKPEKWQYQEDTISQLQAAAKATNELTVMRQQLGAFWKWGEAAGKQLPPQEDVSKYLVSGFMSQVSHTHSKLGAMAKKTTEEHDRLKMEAKFLIETVALKIDMQPINFVEAIQFEVIKKFKSDNDDLLKACRGGSHIKEKPEDIKKFLEYQIESILNDKDFRLLPKDRQSSVVDQAQKLLIEEASNNKQNKKVRKIIADVFSSIRNKAGLSQMSFAADTVAKNTTGIFSTLRKAGDRLSKALNRPVSAPAPVKKEEQQNRSVSAPPHSDKSLVPENPSGRKVESQTPKNASFSPHNK